MKVVESKKKPRDGRWNFMEHRWEERKGKRDEKTGRIDWGPWKPSKKKPPTFSQKNLAQKLKLLRMGIEMERTRQEYVEKHGETKPLGELADKIDELHSNFSYSICGIGKHFHKSNAAVKKKIRALVAKVVGDDKEAQKKAYENLTEGIPDYTEAELREQAKQKDQSFLAEDITAILGVKIFGQGADD